MNQNFKKALVAIMLIPTLIFIGCGKDESVSPASPSVKSSVPANDAIGVAMNATVAFTFSETMDPTTINLTNVTLKAGATSVSGLVTYANKVAFFTPTADLAFNTVYTGTVSAEVANPSGVTLETDYVVSFTTAAFVDEVIPTVTEIAPLNNATNVARNKVISITFSEEMNSETFTASSFTLKQGSNNIAGSIQYTGNTARFIPDNILGSTLSYLATVTTGVTDLAGNAIAVSKEWTFTTGSEAGLSVVNLRASANYVILAKTTITNIPTSAITGDLGLSPAATSFITGFGLTNATGYATSPQVTGKIYAADMASPTGSELTTAVENMLTAYTDAAGRPTPDHLNLLSGNIGGETLQPGLYKWGSTVTIGGDVTLSGSADAVWIFQIDNDLTMAAAKNIILSGGAKAKNVFWQVAGEATIGANSHFEGNILSMTGITLQTGASMNGRALAQTAVVLDANVITKVQ